MPTYSDGIQSLFWHRKCCYNHQDQEQEKRHMIYMQVKTLDFDRIGKNL